jgi:hypothetical protein
MKRKPEQYAAPLILFPSAFVKGIFGQDPMDEISHANANRLLKLQKLQNPRKAKKR